MKDTVRRSLSFNQGLGRRYVSPALSNQVATSPRYQFELAPAAMADAMQGNNIYFLKPLFAHLRFGEHSPKQSSTLKAPLQAARAAFYSFQDGDE